MASFATAAAPPPPPPPMERVLFGLHQQLCAQALRRSTARTRSALEHLLLVLAVGCFGLLLLAHLNFVHGRAAATAATAAAGPGSSSKLRIPATCLAAVPGFDRGCDVTHLSIWDAADAGSHHPSYPYLDEDQPSRQRQQSFVYIDRPDADSRETCREAPPFRNLTLAPRPVLFSFSHTKGLLLLPPEALRELNQTVQHVFVATRDAHCFGEPFLQRIVHHLTGPDTVAMNWILGLAASSSPATWSPAEEDRTPPRPVRFVYNPRTDALLDLQEQFPTPHGAHASADHRHPRHYGYGAAPARPPMQYYYYYNHYPTSFPWSAPVVAKLAVVVKTSFLFFITTTLIAFTLRETQGRMLDFTHQLQAQVRLRQSVSRLVVAHVLENLVFVPQTIGLCFFLTEFYQGDRFLAFVVLSLVWLCEVFSVISLRTAQGLHFFPRIFFLLFSLFHFYLFSFPFGFSYMALASTVLFMAHSALFFWHRHELPAVAHGHVSVHHPRMATTTAATPPTSLHGAPLFATPNQHPVPDSIPMLSSADRRAHGTRSAAEVQPPHFSLSPRHVQPQPPVALHHGSQMATSASITGSRQASSSVLFHPGSLDEDERDESYLFFMNGEVVVHRRPPSTASLRSGISSIHNDDNLSAGEDPRADPASHPIEMGSSASPGGEADSLGFMNDVADVLETSALQAIMEINNSRNQDVSRDYSSGTPRADNLSRGSGDDGVPEPRPSTPDFPNLQDASSPVFDD